MGNPGKSKLGAADVPASAHTIAGSALFIRLLSCFQTPNPNSPVKGSSTAAFTLKTKWRQFLPDGRVRADSTCPGQEGCVRV